MRYSCKGKAGERKKARKIAIYTFVRDRIREKGTPPTLDEVMREVDIPRSLLRQYLTELNGNTVFHYENGRIFTRESVRRMEAIFDHPFLAGMYRLYEELFSETYGEGDRCACEVQGDDMAGAGIRDGDRVIVDMFRQPEDGEMALVCLDGKPRIRTVRYLEGGGVYLCTETAEPEITEVEDPDSFEALGTVWKTVPAEREAS